jgi:pSer/pThr/pTyr-binding forkhead associated (FHA) protein
MSKPIFNLVVESPGSAPRHYQLSARTITIGRGERNAIIIGEDAVSSRHGELRQRESGYDYIDLDSTNGTRLNGEILGSDPRKLHEGDVLLLGLTAKASFIRVIEIRDKVGATAPPQGAVTKKLVRQSPNGPAINPVAAAIAKAARAKVNP